RRPAARPRHRREAWKLRHELGVGRLAARLVAGPALVAPRRPRHVEHDDAVGDLVLARELAQHRAEGLHAAHRHGRGRFLAGVVGAVQKAVAVDDVERGRHQSSRSSSSRSIEPSWAHASLDLAISATYWRTRSVVPRLSNLARSRKAPAKLTCATRRRSSARGTTTTTSRSRA